MNIAICDDEHSSLEYVAGKVKSVGMDCEVVSFSDFADLLEKIKDGAKFDAVLMDIEFHGEQKGIDFAAELYNHSPKTRIIFVTGYSERYSQQIFLKNSNLYGLISKPLDSAILHKNLEKIKDDMILEENRKLLLTFNGIVIGIDPDDIIYIESRAHTATVHSSDGGHLCYERINDLAKRLPGCFVSTHKSFLVNMDKIRRIDRERVILEKNMEVPISKARLNGLRERYFSYIGSNI